MMVHVGVHGAGEREGRALRLGRTGDPRGDGLSAAEHAVFLHAPCTRGLEVAAEVIDGRVLVWTRPRTAHAQKALLDVPAALGTSADLPAALRRGGDATSIPDDQTARQARILDLVTGGDVHGSGSSRSSWPADGIQVTQAPVAGPRGAGGRPVRPPAAGWSAAAPMAGADRSPASGITRESTEAKLGTVPASCWSRWRAAPTW
ncbi:hypothetical protein QJS66_06270 [Kocuria rhizophila]|nr:hypothetical protein QJS66_06270 [Kocuria rhizophila]